MFAVAYSTFGANVFYPQSDELCHEIIWVRHIDAETRRSIFENLPYQIWFSVTFSLFAR